MAAGGYEGLRNAKAALQDGLINDTDYEDVKVAFLRAQQIRAGLEAGFIKESDYHNIKRAFLNSLNLADPSSGAGIRYANGGASLSQEYTASETGDLKLANSGGPASDSAFPLPSSTPASVPSRGSDLGQNGTTTEKATTEKADIPSISTQVSNTTASVGKTGTDRFAAPTNIPKASGVRSKPPGATSMSGISVAEDAVNLFHYLKAKQAYRWAVWKINSAGNQVVIDSAGPPSPTAYQDFLSVLPKTDCRFAVMDMQFTNSEGCVFNKLLFINWAPDAAKMKPKMMYASTKDFFKSYLDGLSNEIQGGDLSDIQESEAQTAVRANVTRQ